MKILTLATVCLASLVLAIANCKKFHFQNLVGKITRKKCLKCVSIVTVWPLEKSEKREPEEIVGSHRKSHNFLKNLIVRCGVRFTPLYTWVPAVIRRLKIVLWNWTFTNCTYINYFNLAIAIALMNRMIAPLILEIIPAYLPRGPFRRVGYLDILYKFS